jgi:hypothetical protein
MVWWGQDNYENASCFPIFYVGDLVSYETFECTYIGIIVAHKTIWGKMYRGYYDVAYISNAGNMHVEHAPTWRLMLHSSIVESYEI